MVQDILKDIVHLLQKIKISQAYSWSKWGNKSAFMQKQCKYMYKYQCDHFETFSRCKTPQQPKYGNYDKLLPFLKVSVVYSGLHTSCITMSIYYWKPRSQEQIDEAEGEKTMKMQRNDQK